MACISEILSMRILKLNSDIRKCRKCRLSETRKNVLCGEGNIKAKLMIIAQAPGENEDREGKMFIGPSGKVLDELLGKSTVDKKQIYMTNLIKCMLPNCRRPKQDEIEMCSIYLDKEIGIVSTAVLVPLGYYATRYIFSKYDITIPPKKELHTVFGTLYVTRERKIFPLPHPAVVLYNSSIKKEIIEKYRKLKVLESDCIWYPVCPMKRYYEERYLQKEWIDRYCQGDWESCVRYQMEESGEFHPDWMLPDGNIDERLQKYFTN